jgi:hypothetical protein
MLASETYLLSKNTTSQITTKITTAAGINAISTPAEVAMPLPPLKRTHGE